MGLHFATLAGQFCRFFVIGSTLGLNLLILGLRLGALGDHFGVFLRVWGQTLDPLLTFLETARKRCKKGEKHGAEVDALSMKFQVFPENGKVRFDCAGASGLRFRPLLFWLCASIFRHLFLHRILAFFGHPWDLQKVRSASEAV